MAVIDSGSSVSGKANVDSNFNLQVNLPTTATQAGFSQTTYNPSTAISKINRITDSGDVYTATSRPLFLYNFNSTSTAWNSIWGINATTMTIVAAANYIRLNNSAITTTTTGVAMYSQRVFKIEDGADLRVKFYLKHTNATATSKQAEFGLGYYNFAAGQANQMNEFIGFRWTTGGGLLGVLGESIGSAPAEQTLSINGNTPYSDSVFREYELVISDSTVEYWVTGTYIGSLSRSTDNGPITKAIAYPFVGRIFNSGAASAAATYDLSSVSIFKCGGEEDLAQGARSALMGKSTVYGQPDLLAAATSPHNFPASATAPTSAVGSNTASVLNNTANIGGLYQMTGTTITATVQTNFIVAAYQNPAVPPAAGAATNARNLIINSISISPMVVNVVLVGGGFVAEWFVGIGGTATSLATADANGTTAVAQKASRLMPLSTLDVLAAAAAVGTVSTRTGDSTHMFTTPLVVFPGEFLHIGIRTLQVTGAITSGNIVGGINVNGYWD